MVTAPVEREILMQETEVDGLRNEGCGLMTHTSDYGYEGERSQGLSWMGWLVFVIAGTEG